MTLEVTSTRPQSDPKDLHVTLESIISTESCLDRSSSLDPLSPMPYGGVDAIPTVAGCGGVYRASGVATGGTQYDAIHPPWSQFVVILRLFRGHSGTIPGSFRSHSRVILESFRGHSGVSLGSFRGQSGVSLGSFRGHSGVIPGSFRGHSGVILGSFRGHFYLNQWVVSRFLCPEPWNNPLELLHRGGVPCSKVPPTAFHGDPASG